MQTPSVWWWCSTKKCWRPAFATPNKSPEQMARSINRGGRPARIQQEAPTETPTRDECIGLMAVNPIDASDLWYTAGPVDARLDELSDWQIEQKLLTFRQAEQVGLVRRMGSVHRRGELRRFLLGGLTVAPEDMPQEAAIPGGTVAMQCPTPGCSATVLKPEDPRERHYCDACAEAQPTDGPKHSPGPWYRGRGRDGEWIIFDALDRFVATVPFRPIAADKRAGSPHTEEAHEANGALIEAGPDLLGGLSSRCSATPRALMQSRALSRKRPSFAPWPAPLSPKHERTDPMSNKETLRMRLPKMISRMAQRKVRRSGLDDMADAWPYLYADLVELTVVELLDRVFYVLDNGAPLRPVLAELRDHEALTIMTAALAAAKGS